MDFVSAVKHCFRNYAITEGRAARSEFWYFSLLCVAISIAAIILDHVLFPDAGFWRGPIRGVTALALLLPGIAVQIRRLHDLDKTWKWGLLAVVPVVGILILTYMNVQRGTAGDNRYGPNPRDGSVGMGHHAAAV